MSAPPQTATSSAETVHPVHPVHEVHPVHPQRNGAPEPEPHLDLPHPATKPFDTNTREALQAYRAEHGLTISQVASELGYHSSQIGRYLAGKFGGNVERLEAIIEDVLKAGAVRKSDALSLFDSTVTKQVHNLCEDIRRTNQIGLIHGDAGVGKTCGIKLYFTRNPSAIHLTLTQWCRDVAGLESLLFDAVQSRGWSGNTRRAAFLAKRLRGSNRLIILDNAQRLCSTSLRWLFDFFDETGCPIALVGNPEVLTPIKRNDQLFSRIGLQRPVVLRDAAKCAARVVERHLPGLYDDIADLADKVASERGHLRALNNRLSLASKMMETPDFAKRHREAFVGAHKQLMSDYELEP